MIAHAVTKQIR